MKSNVGMITYNYNMTHEKVEKQGRDDHCELSHKTALHTVWLARTIVQHIHFYLAVYRYTATILIPSL